jgi:Protein of unknown function (DUF2934)
MSANPAKKLAVTSPIESRQPDLEDQIRVRAYEIYEARGREDGHELEDWFRAKEEMTIKKFRTASA